MGRGEFFWITTMNALDTAIKPTGKGAKLYQLGFRAVGLYMRPDRCSIDVVRELHSAGIRIFAIWEKGNPTSAAFFNARQGQQDASAGSSFAQAMGMPKGKPLFACVDYDASLSDDHGPVLDYMTAFHQEAKARGYLTGVYGSGQTCQFMIDRGVAHYGFLDQSTGHAGHAAFMPKAAIVQGVSKTILGLDCDLDTVRSEEVLW